MMRNKCQIKDGILDQNGVGGHESCAPGNSAPSTDDESSTTPLALSRLRNSSIRFYSPELAPVQHGTNDVVELDATTNAEESSRRLGAKTKRSRT